MAVVVCCRWIVAFAVMLVITAVPRIAAAAAGKQTVKFKDGPPPVTLPATNVYGYAPIDWSLEYDRDYVFNTPTLQSARGFNGAGLYSYNNPKTASTNKKKNKSGCQSTASDPVVVSDGAKVLSIPLFKLPGEMGFEYVLYYHSVNSGSAWAYNPWTSSISYVLDLYCGLTSPTAPCDEVTLYRPDGSSISFSGNHASYGTFPEIGGGGLATLVHNANGTWTLHDEDSTVQTYDASGFLASIKDASGIGWTINNSQTFPNSTTTKTTTTVTHTDGQSITIATTFHDNTTSMTKSVVVTDPVGDQYSYSANGYKVPNGSGTWAFDVDSLTFPGSPATTMTFSYTGSNQLLSSVAYNGTAYWTTSYDSSNRVSADGAADGTERTSIVYSTTSSGMVATITNPLGLTTKNSYTTDSRGNYLLVSVSNSAVQGCGATTNGLAWDANDNLTKTVDNDGVTHTYHYAANGQLQAETAAYGTAAARTVNYVWDSNAQLNRLLSVTVPGESKISYTYSARNRLASATRINLTSVGTLNQSLKTTYAYTLYADGMVETMTVTAPSPGGTNKTIYRYNAHGNVTSVTDGLGHVTTYSGYNGLGEPGHVTGPNGDVTDYTWDARRRLASKTTHPNGVAATWTYAYDGYGLLAKVTAPDGEITTWTRNAEMRVTSITHNDKDGPSTESFGYDANGDVISDVVKRGTDVGKSTSYVYNALGKIYQAKGSHGQVLTYAYDGNGNVLSVTDALGHATSYAYDGLNRVEGSMDAAGGVTSYDYDAGDHVTRVIDPRGLVTTYSYDGLGQLWKQVSPDTGTTTFVHDAYGRLASTTRASGNRITYAYDSLNRPTSVAATNTLGTITRDFTWDTCPNGIGRLCTAVHLNDDTIGYSYTPQGQIVQRSFSFVAGVAYNLGYSYDNMGHLASVIYPDGNQALYDYSHGAVADVRLKIGSASSYAATSVVYRPMDMAMSGWTSSNGLTNTITYDSDLRPISFSGVVSLAFSYDLANRITGITNRFQPTLTQTYTYDAMNRLTGVASMADNESFAYDADGNRTQHGWNGSAITFITDAVSNRLISTSNGVGSTTYGYDADGNVLTANGNILFVYGGFGLVAGANGVESYANGAEGQRLRNTNTVARTQTYFAPDRSGVPLAEDQAGLWLDYVYLNGRLVSVVRSGQVYAAHADQTGRPLMLTDASRAMVWDAVNLPYPVSNRVTVNTFGAFNLMYPGQYADPGIVHNGIRDYNAYLGRYMQSDPIGLAGGINTYVYADNNPVSNIDPLGLCGCTRAQKVAAKLAQLFGAASKVSGALALTSAGLTVASAGVELPSAGTDTPITVGAAVVTARSTQASIVTGLASAGLNAYASGHMSSFTSFLASEGSSMLVEAAASRIPGLSGAAEYLGHATGLVTDEAVEAQPPPCQ